MSKLSLGAEKAAVNRALVLPAPTSSLPTIINACRAIWNRRDELIGVLPLAAAEELRRQSNAIEAYCRGTEAYPNAQRAARVLEMAVGAALGKARPTGRHGAQPLAADNGSSRQLRHEFRTLHNGRERIYPYLNDDEEGHSHGLSREAGLRIAKGLAARAYSSDDDEWYTPEPYIVAAREVMGEIDLDPCSSDIANRVVKAPRFFTKEDDGLDQPWRGRLWMNPPYKREICGAFCDKMSEEVAQGNVSEAIVLVNNITETVFFQRMAEVAAGMCFPRGRIEFWHPDKKNSPIQGQVLVYFGPQLRPFCERFLEFGFTVAVI